MRKGSWSIAGGIGLILTVPAWSADVPDQKGWFIAASVLEADSAGGEEPVAFDDERTGVSLGGGYAFTKHLALEAAYQELGEHTVTTACSTQPCLLALYPDRSADVRTLSVAAIGTWRVAPIVEVFGKVGVLGSSADYRHEEPADTDRGALVGAGIGILATPRWRINVQYQRADHDLELDSAGVGVTYRF